MLVNKKLLNKLSIKTSDICSKNTARKIQTKKKIFVSKNKKNLK